MTMGDDQLKEEIIELVMNTWPNYSNYLTY